MIGLAYATAIQVDISSGFIFVSVSTTSFSLHNCLKHTYNFFQHHANYLAGYE